METADKIVMMLCLFGGFLWLRRRSRIVDLEKRMVRTAVGVFAVLPALLIAGKLLSERFHFGAYADLFLKVVFILLVFPAVGFLFLKAENVKDKVPDIVPDTGRDPSV